MSSSTNQTASTTLRNSTTSVRNNLGPLTTTFVPFKRCSDYTIVDSSSKDEFVEIGVAFYFSTYCGVTETGCLPEATPTGYPNGSPREIGKAFYSPGLICPLGWTTAALATAGSKPDGYGLQNSIAIGTLMPEETAVACCPKGYQFAPDLQQGQCVLNIVQPTESFQACINSRPPLQAVTRTNIGASTTLSETHGGSSVSTLALRYKSVRIMAPAVQLNFRPQDVSKTSDLPYPTSGSNDDNNDGSSTIRGGGIAGIAIGALAGVAGLIVIAIWMLRQRRASKKQIVDGDGGFEKPELECPPDTRQELDSQPRSELPDNVINSQPAELDAANCIPNELPGDDRRASRNEAGNRSRE